MYKSVETYYDALDKLFQARLEGKITQLTYKLDCLNALETLLKSEDGGDEWIAVHFDLGPDDLWECWESNDDAVWKEYVNDAIDYILLFKKYGFLATVSRLKNELIEDISQI